MEMNLGFRNTTVIVNTYRVEEGRQPVGRNAIMNAFGRMTPQVSVIAKIPQSNVNHDGWQRARKNQTKQLLVMLGGISVDELKYEYPDGIPNEFGPDQQPRLTRNQVIFYDEAHLQQEVGSATTTGYQIRFPRASEGRYSPLSSSNPEPIFAEKVTKTSFKYAGQSRL